MTVHVSEFCFRSVPILRYFSTSSSHSSLKHEDVLFHMSLGRLSIWAISSATIEVFGFYSDLFGAHQSLAVFLWNLLTAFTGSNSIAGCPSIAMCPFLLEFNQMASQLIFFASARHIIYLRGRSGRSARAQLRGNSAPLAGLSPTWRVIGVCKLRTYPRELKWLYNHCRSPNALVLQSKLLEIKVLHNTIKLNCLNDSIKNL